MIHRFSTGFALGVTTCLGLCLAPRFTPQETAPAARPTSTTTQQPMHLGAFSISLTVKDLAKSREFYEKLGFSQLGGDGEHYLIMKNGNALVGLFQGMFDKNILTFNPGWDESGKNVPEFTDVRELQKLAKERGLELTTEADESTTGPASFVLVDPDGNPILVDQHR